MVKKCNHCEQNKPLEDFPLDKRSKDGHTGKCKLCEAIYQKIYREKNKDKLNQYYREKYNNDDNYRLEKKRLCKKYNERHREELVQYQKEYTAVNKEKRMIYFKLYRSSGRAKEILKRWIQHNPEKMKIFSHKRYINRKAAKANSDLSYKKWIKILSYFDYKCVYCGKKEILEQEHIVPLSRGGKHDEFNVVPACRSCNASKHNKSLLVWLVEKKHAFTSS